MMKHRGYIFIAGLLIGAVLYWLVDRFRSHDSRAIVDLRGELQFKVAELDKLRAELTSRGLESKALVQKFESITASLQSSDPAAEQEIGEWLTRVGMVRRYQETHPQLNIPEMAFLKVSDWLDVAKENKFETDADLRMALANVRSIAKSRAGMMIAPLLAEAQKGGHPLPAMLSSLTNNPTLQLILDRYSLFDPSHPPPGYQAKGVDIIVVETTLVEPGVDLPQWYTKGGGFGLSGISDLSYPTMRDAVAEFTRNRGLAPRSVEDVRPYLKDFPGVIFTPDIFNAVRTPVRSE